MLTKDQFLKSCDREIRIIKHLATKLPVGCLDWRPTQKQRSMLELMQYLTVCGTTGAIHAATNTWDGVEQLELEAERVTPDNFALAMDRQASKLREIVSFVSHEQLVSGATTLPWGAPCLIGEGFIEMALKPLTAYRMQFFLYLKECGRTDMGPANCWIGVDAPSDGPPPAPALPQNK